MTGSINETYFSSLTDVSASPDESMEMKRKLTIYQIVSYITGK